MRRLLLNVFACLSLCSLSGAVADVGGVDSNDSWRYRAEVGRPSADWRAISFDDSSWSVGRAGFGYGDDDDATVLSDMRGNYADVYLRRTFEANDIPQTLILYIDYDDAFAAYLNGHGVAFGGYTEDEIHSHEAGLAEAFKIDPGLLKKGRNVLAIHGRNRSLSSSDFSLNPLLLTQPVEIHDMTSVHAREILADLRSRLVKQSSYLERTNRDPIKVLDAFAASLDRPISRTDLIRAMQQVVALVGDGHASVRADYLSHGAIYLPFSLAEVDGGIVGIDVRKSEPFERQFPFVRAIDGVPIEDWIRAAARYVSRASPQLNRRRALRAVQRIDLLRYDLGLPDSETAVLTIGDEASNKDVSVRLSKKRPKTARVPLQKARILANNIGYLPIEEMDGALVPSIRKQLKTFAKTDGLIIDVRGNGGGRYDITRAIAPYFLPANSPPFVANIAKYRLADSFDADHLASRPTYRISDANWSSEERTIIASALADFEPIWEPPADKFSEWHFMMVNRDSDRTRQTFYYGKPVIVLSDAASFSATDGFLSVFASLPQVTLMGQASGGGSGRTQRFTLPSKGLKTQEMAIAVALSSMASFRANGQLFDGYGVAVDIEVKPTLADVLGESDSVLARAKDHLSK